MSENLIRNNDFKRNIEMAKGVKRSIYLYINGEEVENNIKSISSKMTKLINEQKKMTIGSDEYNAHTQKIKQLRNVIDEHNLSLKSTATNWDKLKTNVGNIGNIVTGVTLGMQSVNQMIGSLKKMATDLAAMDDIYSDVMKYTGMTREEVAGLNEEFKKMDTRTSREELNRLAGEAGKLGITGKENIMDFVDTANIINVALGEDLGEDAVKNIGKMAEMFGETDRLGLRGAMLATGSAINTIGQESSASEPYLMEFTARLSGTANQAKITQAEVLGYASVLDQNMQQLEMSATAMQNLIMKMMQNPAKFAKMAGVEVSKFSNLLKTDANEAVLTLIDSLSKRGGLSQLAPMFKEMGLDGVRASGVISVLANNIDKIREEQEKASKAYNEGTSAINEYNIKNNNLQAELEKARKKFQDTRLELGEKLYPVLINLTKTSTGFIKVVSTMSGFVSENKGLVVALVSAWAAYVVIMIRAKVATTATNIITKASTTLMTIQRTAVLASSMAYNKLTGNTTRAAAAQQLLKTTMASTPWGAVLAAVSAIGIGIYKLVTRQSEAEKAMKIFNSEAAKQEAEAMSLFAALKKTTKGTKDYKDILKIILDKYPFLLQNQIDEEGNLKNIEEAYRSVTKAIRENTAEKIKAETATEITTKYIEEQKKQYDKLRKYLEKEGVQSNLISKIVDDINTELEKPLSTYSDLNSIFKKYFGAYYSVYHKQAYSVFKKIRENMIDYKQDINEIEKSFSPFIGKKTNTPVETEPDDLEGEKAKNKITGFDEDYEKKYKAYLERLKDFRRQHLFDEQSDFIKEIATTKAAYDEMIEKAEKFKDKKTAIELGDEKQKAIEAIVIKRAKDLSKKINELSSKSTENQLLDAIAGQTKKYNDVIDETDSLINSLTELNKIEKDPEIVKTIDELWTKRKNAVAERSQEINDIINKYTKEISDSLLPEHEKQIKGINDRYDKEIEIVKAAIEEKKKLGLTSEDEEIKQLEETIKKLEEFRDKELNKNKLSLKGKLAKMLGIEEDDLDKILEEASKFFNTLADGIVKISANRNEKELNDFKKKQDAERDTLQQKLDQGVVSQDEYNERIAALDKELNDKELQIKKEQWKKDQAAAISQAIINAALGITEIWAKWSETPYIAGILTAISAAATAIEIATIASEPEPYAKGGYIDKEKIIKIGEKGKKEWVASNTLVANPVTAPIIKALDDYQKGKKQGFNAMHFSTPSFPLQDTESFFTNTPTTPRKYVMKDENDSMLEQMILLNKYMSDPKNRQAIISRKIQTKFDVNESKLKNISTL